VSFRSVHEPSTRLTVSMLSNTSSGAWPIASYLEDAAGVG